MNDSATSRLTERNSSLAGTASLVQRSRELSRPWYLFTIIALTLITLVLGFVAFYLTPSTGTAAIWWPAAGTSAILYLLYRGPRWQVVMIIAVLAGLSNLLIGRPLVFAIAGTFVIASEIIAFGLALGPQGRTAMLSSTRGLLRFVFAVLAASVTVGVTGSLMFWGLAGVNPLVTFASLVPSHVSAFVLIAPLALIPLTRRKHGQVMELGVQVALTTTVALFIFAPFQNASISALILPFLGWAAVRFPAIIVTLEIMVLGVIVSVFTVLGGGPFAAPVNAVPSSVLVQIYLLSIAATLLYLAVSRSEREELRAANERTAALLRGGFVGSQVGSLFLRTDTHHGPRIVEMNEVANDLVDNAWFDKRAIAWFRDHSEEFTTEVNLDNGQTIQVYGRRVPTDDGETVLAIQLVDVTDFVRAQETLKKTVALERQMVEELREMAAQKDDFVSAVSHELRTPITSIVGFAEDLHETASDEQKEYSSIILRNATRLTAMVEELLELGRMTAPNPVQGDHRIDLATVVREVVEDQSVTARDRSITLDTQLSPSPTYVMGNANALDRIVTNLLSNAIKFTPNGGQVTLTTVESSDRFRVSLVVDDSGPGISSDDAPHVFERFFRSSSAERRKTPGTGLGLSIVKSLVELMEGTVEISRSPLGGARITVTIPVVDELTPV